MALRILGLDDDNHSPMYVCENLMMRFDTAKELIEFLALPHLSIFEVKMFALVDEWTEELEQWDEDDVNDMFDFLEGHGLHKPDNITAEEIFELFWNAANRNYW